jgi:tudor domain-containing protein 2
MVIRGSRERIKHAEVLIKKIIDEQPVMEKISVEIPQRVIGRIIGKGGKTIRQLCRISGISLRPIFSVANSPQPLFKGLPLLDFSHIGAKLKIDSENETGDSRKCDIIGTQTQIECAKQLIDEKIAEDKEFRSRRKSTQEGNYISSSSTRH